uniref:Uncharacterized protein n=1 Tax=Magallana gigas TaxID=29159 RepID=K1R4L0_MAGGI
MERKVDEVVIRLHGGHGHCVTAPIYSVRRDHPLWMPHSNTAVLYLICGTNVGIPRGSLAIERREPVRRKRRHGVQSGE